MVFWGNEMKRELREYLFQEYWVPESVLAQGYGGN